MHSHIWSWAVERFILIVEFEESASNYSDASSDIERTDGLWSKRKNSALVHWVHGSWLQKAIVWHLLNTHFHVQFLVGKI